MSLSNQIHLLEVLMVILLLMYSQYFFFKTKQRTSLIQLNCDSVKSSIGNLFLNFLNLN
jgi:hypothetical protein